MNDNGCFGLYMNDRTCQLCEVINIDTVNECKKIYEEGKEIQRKLYNIRSRCKYKIERVEDCMFYDACNKNGNVYRYNEDTCHPTFDCEKYCE